MSYLDTYMASVGVAELGKYQVREEKEGERERDGTRRAKESARFFRFRRSLSLWVVLREELSSDQRLFPLRIAVFSARGRASISLFSSANAGHDRFLPSRVAEKAKEGEKGARGGGGRAMRDH